LRSPVKGPPAAVIPVIRVICVRNCAFLL
jgi:hypothetical protein